MKCPKCGREQPEARDCAFCGVVVEKYVARQNLNQSPPAKPALRPRVSGSNKASRSAFALPTALPAMPKAARLLSGLKVARELLIPPTSARRRFYASLARMVRSGVGLEEGLQTLQLSGRGALRDISTAALRGLRAGTSLAASLAVVPRLVPTAQRTILHAGETTGHLSEVLEQLEAMDADALALSRKLVASMAYPLVVLLMSCIIMPLPTLVLGTVGGYLTEVAGRIGGLLAVLSVLWLLVRAVSLAAPALFRRVPAGMELLLRPGRKSLFFLVLRTSLRSGVPIREALNIGALVWDSQHSRALFSAAVSTIDQGGTLTQALSPMLEPEWVVILATGEKSGTLEESFAELFESYSQRAAARRKILLIVATVLLTVAVFAYAASQVMGAYQQTVEAPMQELELMMDREMRGIWNGL